VSDSELVTPLSPPFVTRLLELVVLIGMEEGWELRGALESMEVDEKEAPAGFVAADRENCGCDGTGGAAICSGLLRFGLPSKIRWVGLMEALRYGESGVGVTSFSPFSGLRLNRETDFVGVLEFGEPFDLTAVGFECFGRPRSLDGKLIPICELEKGEVGTDCFWDRLGPFFVGLARCELSRSEAYRKAAGEGCDATTISSSRILL
jgi:hypothetical protein